MHTQSIYLILLQMIDIKHQMKSSVWCTSFLCSSLLYASFLCTSFVVFWGCVSQSIVEPNHDHTQAIMDVDMILHDHTISADTHTMVPDAQLTFELDAQAYKDLGLVDLQVDQLNLCEYEMRCRNRIVETCDFNTGQFSELEVCTREERCIENQCESLPSIYGQTCRTAPQRETCIAAGLSCGGRAAIPFCLHHNVRGGQLIEDGGDCYSGRDCTSGLCTRSGICSRGQSGDPCHENLDCRDQRVCDAEQNCQ